MNVNPRAHLPAVLFDIDGVIADNSHRWHYIADRKHADWMKYYAGLSYDKPIQGVIDLINLLRPNYQICLVTGRPERLDIETTAWMFKNRVHFDRLYMRPDKDFSKNAELKKKLLDERIRPNHSEIHGAFDDNPEAVKMYRDNGIMALQLPEQKDARIATA
jgi:hypothetical protein